ncbi:hypothetical protein ZWY2020_026694 [Hordeum vulgare]|nr:hypothetical protein ZWY2020_026684 [Hordeum vulgare]KAI5002044.1 hypothetical protein ZWY2020_026694 [Hordeum vulgare]
MQQRSVHERDHYYPRCGGTSHPPPLPSTTPAQPTPPSFPFPSLPTHAVGRPLPLLTLASPPPTDERAPSRPAGSLSRHRITALPPPGRASADLRVRRGAARGPPQFVGGPTGAPSPGRVSRVPCARLLTQILLASSPRHLAAELRRQASGGRARQGPARTGIVGRIGRGSRRGRIRLDNGRPR